MTNNAVDPSTFILYPSSGAAEPANDETADSSLVTRHSSLGAELRSWLAARLPAAMIPSAFVALDALPMTPNGKLDRSALPAPDLLAGRSDRVAPRTPEERAIVAIWAELLPVAPDAIGVDDNFFALGGHSLLATQLLSHVREAFAVEPSLRAFFENPTPAGLAAAIGQAQRLEDPDRIEHVADAVELLGQIDQLSDDQVAALLGGLLAEEEMPE